MLCGAWGSTAVESDYEQLELFRGDERRGKARGMAKLTDNLYSVGKWKHRLGSTSAFLDPTQ